MKTLAAAVAATAMLAAAGSAHAARDYVWAAGSSTVFPFATRVAENFARKTGRKAPKVESLGTGGGLKIFCGGMGEAFPDIADASRPMKRSEFDACAKNGVKDITEIRIGFDGIVIAADRRAPDFNFSVDQLYQGLSANALVKGQLTRNPYHAWNQVGPRLPASKILVYGPPPTSGTRDAFIELGIEAGAVKFPVLAATRKSNEKLFKQQVDPLRNDGWIDAGENDNAIVGTITRTPGALGVFGFSYLEENRDKIKAAAVGGVKPTVASIADHSYPLSRTLFIYVKGKQVAITPGLRQFIDEFTSDAATGRGGYLQDRGLIPLPPPAHAAQKAVGTRLPNIGRPAS